MEVFLTLSSIVLPKKMMKLQWDREVVAHLAASSSLLGSVSSNPERLGSRHLRLLVPRSVQVADTQSVVSKPIRLRFYAARIGAQHVAYGSAFVTR
jgi:hypothetical protein